MKLATLLLTALAWPATAATLVYQDGVTQVFNPSTALAGLNVGAAAGDPTLPVNGDLWYDSTANELTARINGTNVALGAGGSGNVGGSIDPLNFAAATTLTLASGAVTVTQTLHVIAAESGIADTVDSIAGGAVGDVLIVRPDEGDAITFSNGTTGGDNLDLAGQNVVLNSANESLTLGFNGTNWTILGVSPSVITVDLTGQQTDVWIIYCSAPATNLVVAVDVIAPFRIPFDGTITKISATMATAPTGANMIADVEVNGTSVMASSKVVIEVAETSTDTAGTQPTVTASNYNEGDMLSIDIEQIGSTAPGKDLILYITYTH